MENFLPVVFVIALFAVGIAEDKRCREDENGKEILKMKEYASLVELIGATIVLGILCYWSRKWWLIPIIELFTPVDNRIVVFAMLVIFVSIDYIVALQFSLIRVPFLVSAFISNCILAALAPIASIVIVAVFAVCVYGRGKKEILSLIEYALVKSMVAVSALLTILEVIEINLSFIGLFLIIVLTLMLAILIEKYIRKRTF